MQNAEIWKSFDQVYCLTLEGDLERQRHASAELCSVGLYGFRFIDGIKAESDAVHNAYRTGMVKAFPPCFRCGLISCGSDDCNNLLIESQVGCFLSFLKIFQIAVASGSNTFLVFEDDLKFFDYTPALATAALAQSQLDKLGLFSEDPCLVGLGRGLAPNEVPSFDGDFVFIQRRKIPQNPGFAFNRAFAIMALERFDKINHTSDVYIHFQISDHARHYSLNPPFSYELSTSIGTLSSKIHPKQVAFENTMNSEAMRASEKQAFDRHLKHVKRIPLAVLGAPRGGTKYMASTLKSCGLDVGHEVIGEDGICSWLFAVSDTDLPFGEGLYARNSKFVFADMTIAVIRSSPQAIFSTQLENCKNIQSFCFRKRWIKTLLDVDVEAFATDFEQALATYVFWHRIIMARRPVAWIKLERAAEDLQRLFAGKLIEKRQDVDLTSLRDPVNARKAYFGQHYDSIVGDFAASLRSADPFLRKSYDQLRGELFTVFEGN
ncbi:glycosyltransferase family 25 protein [Methylobacterium sp. EM32]|uniref:glycosyltransferase family 25 protein n=1 Tax=Methylobacterium sp. EM32 TaxID=3163481 RepID=UPI0033B95F92